jgi:hypothetical protein
MTYGSSAYGSAAYGSTSGEGGPGSDEPTASWFDSNWSYRKSIDIDSGQVTADLSGYPVPIEITGDGDLGSNAQSSGDDIFFTADDGTTKLNHEIESYDPATGDLYAWVQVATLSSSSDTSIFIYYGNGSAANQENVTGTWDGDYIGVYHFEADPGAGTLPDSTANANDGTVNGTLGSAQEEASVFSNGWNFDGGSSVEFGSDLIAGSAGLTVEIWYVDPAFDDGRAFNTTGTGTSQTMLWPDNANGLDFILEGSRVSDSDTSLTGAVSQIGRWDGSTMSLHRNGTQIGTASYTNSLPDSGNAWLGDSDGTGSSALTDLVDELRLSSVDRGAAYVETTDNLLRNSGALLTVGTQETATQPITLTGSAATVTVAEPTGDATAPVTATTSAPTTSVQAPSGAVAAPATGTGTAGVVGAVEPAGAIQASTTATGSVATVTATGPSGTTTAPTIATGSTAVVTVVQPAGSTGGIVLTSSTATVTAAGPNGTASAPTTVTGDTTTVDAVAPPGQVLAPTTETASVGVVTVEQPAGAFAPPGAIVEVESLVAAFDLDRAFAGGFDITRDLIGSITMPARTNQDVDTYWEGDTLHLDVTCYTDDRNSTPKDLSGASIEWTLRPLPAFAPELTKTLENGIVDVDLGAGEFRVEIDDGETQGLSGEYYHKVVVTDSDGNQTTILTGWIDIDPS